VGKIEEKSEKDEEERVRGGLGRERKK